MLDLISSIEDAGPVVHEDCMYEGFVPVRVVLLAVWCVVAGFAVPDGCVENGLLASVCAQVALDLGREYCDTNPMDIMADAVKALKIVKSIYDRYVKDNPFNDVLSITWKCSVDGDHSSQAHSVVSHFFCHKRSVSQLGGGRYCFPTESSPWESSMGLVRRGVRHSPIVLSELSSEYRRHEYGLRLTCAVHSCIAFRLDHEQDPVGQSMTLLCAPSGEVYGQYQGSSVLREGQHLISSIEHRGLSSEEVADLERMIWARILPRGSIFF